MIKRAFLSQTRSLWCLCSGSTDGGYWVVTGGTGRFEGASGTMSSVNVPEFESIPAVSVGTLTVRRDLWQEIIPFVESDSDATP